MALAALVAPASANAAPVVVGSPLTAPANGTMGCETALILNASTGDYFQSPSGQPDCTWTQQGVFGVLNDPRGRTAPFSGTITSVSVKSGPNPAPLRFVVLRQLAQPGGASDYCCYFTRESNEVQPRPNDITTFQTNIPVERIVLPQSQILSFDLVGISARAGTGSLPLSAVGPQSAGAYTTPGAVNAGFYYPRLGRLPDDEPAGRHEFAVSNIELLVRWTFCETGDPTCQPGTPPVVPPVPPTPPIVLPPTPPIVVAPVPLNTIAAPRAVNCSALTGCPFVVTLPGPGTIVATDANAAGRAVAAAKKKPKYKPLVAKTTTTVTAAGKLKLMIKLTSAGVAALKTKGTLKIPVKLVYTPSGGQAGTKTVTFTFRKPKKKS
ncbi:MAG: hypothetical protein QOH13_1274 [Thermoleophilaceae bacterium]|nr:hypothetical protein [Thermoleophilaceae bacterium]